MVTATDDQSDQLSALEAGVSELRTEFREFAAETNARLTSLESGVSELRAEIRADIRALNDRQDRLQAENALNQTATNARIHRVFWAVISVGLLIGAGIIGTMLTLVFHLT